MDYTPRIEYMVEAIAKILTASNIEQRTKKNLLKYVPDLHEIPTERHFTEIVSINDNKVCRMNLGIGYEDNKCFYRRDYAMLNGIKYNKTEWQLFNINQLN